LDGKAMNATFSSVLNQIVYFSLWLRSPVLAHLVLRLFRPSWGRLLSYWKNLWMWFLDRYVLIQRDYRYVVCDQTLMHPLMHK